MTVAGQVDRLSDEALADMLATAERDAEAGVNAAVFPSEHVRLALTELQHRREAEAGSDVPRPDIWNAAHELAATEYPRIMGGICQQPGLAGALATFALRFAASPPSPASGVRRVTIPADMAEEARDLLRLYARVPAWAELANRFDEALSTLGEHP